MSDEKPIQPTEVEHLNTLRQALSGVDMNHLERQLEIARRLASRVRCEELENCETFNV